MAEAEGIDPQRLRRRLVFQRVLARLGDNEAWVLKGGFCLEVRFGLLSRATKDLDLVAQAGWGASGALDLQEQLDEALDRDLDDGFTFDVQAPRPMAGDDREAWRIALTARLDGVVFAQVRLDIIVQYDELTGAVERLVVPPPVAGLDLPAVEVAAVDVDQHAAEKIHAYSRVYAGDRPSSRVKDLVDLILLIESGVLMPERLRERLHVVFEHRDGVAPPGTLPDPPEPWRGDYESMLAEHELDVGATTVDSAFATLSAIYADVIQEGPTS